MSYLDFVHEDSTTDPNLKEEESEAETSKLPQDLIRPTLYVKCSACYSSTVKCSFFATILYITLLDPFCIIRGHVFVDEVDVFLFCLFRSLVIF